MKGINVTCQAFDAAGLLKIRLTLVVFESIFRTNGAHH